MNKLQLLTFSLTGTILASAIWLSPTSASTKTTDTTNTGTFSSQHRTTQPSFLEKITSRVNQQYSQVKQQIESQIQNLGRDFTGSLGQLSQEVQSQVQAKINSTIGALGLPDLVKAGEQIESTISNTKADILHLDPRIKGKNAREDWNRKYTTNQAQSVLGTEGQKTMQQRQEVARLAVDTASSNAEAAQSDLVTQDIMKKVALQNAQIAKVLDLVQDSLQQQNQIAATQNVNLSDIAQNLSTSERRKQNEAQANVNAIYRNAAFADGFWGSISRSGNNK